MKRSFREEFGITLTLPRSLEHRRRVTQQRRLRRIGVVALLALGAALVAIGLYRPAKAAFAARADLRGQCVAQDARVDQHGEL